MSQADVSYSCWCGYQLNLSSANRIIGTTSKYRESMKKGVISFQSIDLSRFTQVDEVSCLPFYLGRNDSKTKLMCRQCGVHIGYGYRDGNAQCVFDSRVGSDPSYKKVVMKIRALQPSHIDG
ncbi:unnamed protein product [Lactuca saligna]|uniref:Uncharacterized protein n=1 Tax=Lactuca saligna TaxID=75948 RepID=A0AA35Z967_LACSI|nr:unnamed protein product [Lactuca saligna]